MINDLKDITLSVEKRALIVWYYQCKKFTPIRISVLAKVDIDTVKSILSCNVPEFEQVIREEKVKAKFEKWQRSHTVNFSTYTA